MALSHEVSGIRGLIQKIEHPRAWQAERQTPIALFERSVSNAQRLARRKGVETIVAEGVEDVPFFVGFAGEKKVYLEEDQAYRALSDEGRDPENFSWVPEEALPLGNGKKLETSIHKNRRDPSVVYVERDAFDQDGKRYMRTVAVAPKTQRYDELLANPIKSDKDQELSAFFTPLKRPSSGEVIEVDFQ